MPRVFFATDRQGSEMGWRKFWTPAKFYDADVLICGGDMRGKAMIPIVEENGHYTVTIASERQVVGGDEGGEKDTQSRRKGYYPVHVTPARLQELDQDADVRKATFQQIMLDGVRRWMNMAAEKLRGSGVRIFVCPGNDDEMEVDDVVRESDMVELGEGRMVEIDGFTMISTGWSNHTPWNTHREETEEKLGERIEAMARQVSDQSRAIFNLHCPPFRSGLDAAPAIDADLKLLHGRHALRPVGPTAVDAAIEKHPPLLQPHGQLHESEGAVKVRKTLSINPGSAYEEGMLMAAIINLDAKKGIKSYQLVNG